MQDYNLRTNKSWNDTLSELSDTMDKWGIEQWNVIKPRGARLTGFVAASSYQSLEDRTVTLRYTKNGREVALAMGKQNRAVDNLRVLYLAAEAMRLNEKRGIAEVVQQAYAQLQAPEHPVIRDPYELLGVRPDAPLDVIEAAFRARMKAVHPDTGGSDQQAKQLTAAIEQLRRERK
jgi:DnaJ-domain-containing protein 1